LERSWTLVKIILMGSDACRLYLQERFGLIARTVVDMVNFAVVPSIIVLQLVAFHNLFIILSFM
jgi:hypothetical protein